MTEIPEHLLQRSRERRAALGLGGGDEGGAASPPPAASGGDEGAEPSPVPARAAAAPAEATATSSAPPVAAPPPPPPPYVQAALSRPRIPRWALPVLGILPLWGLIYAGTLVSHDPGITDPVLQEGQAIYTAQCSACHGAGGAGGTGRPLNGGEVVLTFPDPADHIAWVTNGSPAPGTPYGDPARPGGQHISQDAWPAMPAFGGSLTEEEIIAVVRYEREVIGGEDSTTAALATGEGTNAEGSADAPANEAQQEGGNVGGQGSGGETDDASPGGGGEPEQSDNETGSPSGDADGAGDGGTGAGGEGDTTSGTTPPDQ